MTQFNKTFSVFLGGLLLCGLGLPRVSSGAQTCTNASIAGTYNASVQSANFQNVMQSLAASTATATTAAVATTGGLGSNPASLSGSIPGLGRYWFDGNGTILGLGVTNGVSQTFSNSIGSYTVNSDCTARLTLSTGQAFDGVIVESGDQVLFVETDALGSGSVGTLQRSRNACYGGEVPNSIGFSFFGAQTAAATTGSTGAASAMSVIPYGAIGEMNFQAEGTFNMAASVMQNGGLQRVTGSGTYTLGSDCSIKLTLNSNSLGGTTGAVSALLPLAFRGLISSKGRGVLTMLPSGGALVTGSFVVQ